MAELKIPMNRRTFSIDFNLSPDHSIDYFLGMLNDSRITTLQKVKNLSVAELDWQYKPGWNTIGSLLSHMIALEHYFRIAYVEGKTFSAEDEEQWLPALDLGDHLPKLINGSSFEFYQAGFEESRSLFLNSFKNISFDLFKNRREGYDKQTGCNMAWVLYHMIEDEIQHRGQITLLLKLQKN